MARPRARVFDPHADLRGRVVALFERDPVARRADFGRSSRLVPRRRHPVRLCPRLGSDLRLLDRRARHCRTVPHKARQPLHRRTFFAGLQHRALRRLRTALRHPDGHLLRHLHGVLLALHRPRAPAEHQCAGAHLHKGRRPRAPAQHHVAPWPRRNVLGGQGRIYGERHARAVRLRLEIRGRGAAGDRA